MNDITIRFLAVYEYFKKEKIIHTPKGFATEINVSTSLMTEIFKKRTNAGITPIQNLLERFKTIDGNWLLTGDGDMIRNIEETRSLTFLYKELAESRLDVIDGLKFKINSLEIHEKEIKIYEKQDDFYGSVAEPAPKLKK